jgi:hypothetical protein
MADVAAVFAEHGAVPIVLQCTKRDLGPPESGAVSQPVPMEQLAALVAPWNAPAFPSVATRGEGVWEAFAELTRRSVESSLDSTDS